MPTPEQSQAPQIPPAQGDQQAQVPIGGVSPLAAEPAVSGAPLPAGHQILSREERVEYRDQHGNLLNEEQVEALKGKVEFKTRYETRTRLVDADGNEIPSPDGGAPEENAAVAPPHPDVQGTQ